MGFLDSLKSLLGGHSKSDETGHWIYVRCGRCGEVIKTRLDLLNNLTQHDEGGYIARKTMVGNQLCFQRIEVTLIFDERRRLAEQTAVGGDIITAEAFDLAQQ